MASNPRGNAAKRIADASAGPWESWGIPSRHGRAIRFIETYCRPPKGHGHGQPMVLADFQKHFLEEALADGIEVGLLATPRGNGKSSFGGALALWALFADDETGAPQVPIVATTVGQAIRSVYGVAVSMLKAEPELLRRSLIFTGIGTSRVTVPSNDGEMFPISNDPDGLQGLDPSTALIDEIGFQPQASFDALTLASGKRERGLLLGVGTPGLTRDNALFNIRRAIRERGSLPAVVFHEYAAPDGCKVDDREAWRAANPAIGAGFLRESTLEKDLGLAEFQEGPFRIFRLGQWYEGVDSWLGPNGRPLWDALAEPWDFVAGAPTWVGVDVALVRDSTAVVAVQRDEKGVLHTQSKFWLPTKDDPVDVTDVMEHIRELHRAYAVKAVSFDPRFFDVPAKMLDDEGIKMVKVDQSPERMTPACGDLLALIKESQPVKGQPARGLRHERNATLDTHVLNAVPRFNQRGFTLEKSKSRGRIDGCIALALAVAQALPPVKVRPALWVGAA